MKLSKRLKAICDMVDPNSKVIDIGTDHGYVPIYLTLFKNCQCLATDISEKSLNKAKNNAKKIKANIDFMCTDGLENIKLENQIIIISGMGTSSILKILKDDIDNDLIIATNNDVKTLIEKLRAKNYYVFKNEISKERNIYQIIYFKKQR